MRCWFHMSERNAGRVLTGLWVGGGVHAYSSCPRISKGPVGIMALDFLPGARWVLDKRTDALGVRQRIEFEPQMYYKGRQVGYLCSTCWKRAPNSELINHNGEPAPYRTQKAEGRFDEKETWNAEIPSSK